MISLAKILFTIAAVIGVWATFNAIRRWKTGEPRITPAEHAARAAREAVDARMREHETRQSAAVDMVRCDACGQFHDSRLSCICGQKRSGSD